MFSDPGWSSSHGNVIKEVGAVLSEDFPGINTDWELITYVCVYVCVVDDLAVLADIESFGPRSTSSRSRPRLPLAVSATVSANLSVCLFLLEPLRETAKWLILTDDFLCRRRSMIPCLWAWFILLVVGFPALTHTHTCLTALFPGLTGSAGTRKVKPI